LEESKQIFIKGSVAEQSSRKHILLKILKNSLKILHPFMPYITEEIWQILINTDNKLINTDDKINKLLMIQKWPSNN